MTRTCQDCNIFWPKGVAMQTLGPCDPEQANVLRELTEEAEKLGLYYDPEVAKQLHEENHRKMELLQAGIERRTRDLDLAARFTREGHTWVELNDEGKVVKKTPTYVLKTDGPTAGRGIFVTTDVEDFLSGVRDWLGGLGPNRLIIELLIEEEEVLEQPRTQGGSAGGVGSA